MMRTGGVVETVTVAVKRTGERPLGGWLPRLTSRGHGDQGRPAVTRSVLAHLGSDPPHDVGAAGHAATARSSRSVRSSAVVPNSS